MSIRPVTAILFLACIPFHGQTQANTTLTARSTLVLVPALVKTKAGGLVYTLTAKDFVLTDDGVEQLLTLDQEIGDQPLALVVAIETGSDGARQLEKYGNLPTLVEAIAGNVPHQIAVVSFDSIPTLQQDFTGDVGLVRDALHNLAPGDRKAAILDALSYSVGLLSHQPTQYRRAILIISETVDRGSHTTFDEAVRDVSDNNTAIFTVAFSSSKSNIKREAPQTLGQSVGGIPIPGLSSSSPQPPGPVHGCMSRDASDPQVDLSEKRAEQAWDCLSLLAPPLRIAKIAFLAAINGLARNVPETVAHLTGGEYYAFNNSRSLEKDLLTISNHVPNRYILSFQPQAPHPGLHALQLGLLDRPEVIVTARVGYWVDSDKETKPAGPSPPH